MTCQIVICSDTIIMRQFDMLNTSLYACKIKVYGFVANLIFVLGIILLLEDALGRRDGTMILIWEPRCELTSLKY
jgi:hypothetical protein